MTVSGAREPVRPRPALLGLVCALLISAALGRNLYVHLMLDPQTGRSGPIDGRYAELRRALPAEPRLAYVSDQPRGWLYHQALYSLAPHVFVAPGEFAAHGIADLHDTGKLDEVCRANGWRPIAVFSGGAVALLERAQ